MTPPPPGLRFVRDPELASVSRLMQASWAEPCWVYDEPLLAYHLRRPSVDPDLLLGLKDETSGELVAYYALMPLDLRVRGTARRAVFGSFLTAATTVRRQGAARAVQVRLLEQAIAKGYEEYLAFCEVGAVSNESIGRSCASLGLATVTMTTVNYLALPAVTATRRAPPRVGEIHAYVPGDGPAAEALLDQREPQSIEIRHDARDYDARFAAPVARTFFRMDGGALCALAHLVVLDVSDGGRRFRNAYLRDFAPGELAEPTQREFLWDVIRAVAAEGCHLVVVASRATAPAGLMTAMGFRQTGMRLNLLTTALQNAPSPPPDALVDLRLDVF